MIKTKLSISQVVIEKAVPTDIGNGFISMIQEKCSCVCQVFCE